MADPTETLDATGVGFADTRPAPSAPSSGFPVADWERYIFVRRLGEGGMGAVYEARDLRLERLVALKFIRGGDPRLSMRLAREARAQARIDHPNVCKVFEVGEIEGKAYIAMELVDGLPLGGLAAHLSLHDKVAVVRDVALALHEAHKLGILHRDVKPSNILVETKDGGRLRPVVMDFGIAREEGGERGLTETGALLGTPAYMSPEQARGGGRGLDRRSDVYSLGATLYELLAGTPPFEGDSVMTVVLAVLNDEPRRLRARIADIPEDLETIVSKCLSKEPGQRYDSAKALAEDLERYIGGEPILGRREGVVRRIRRTARKHRALVATAVLALAAAGVAGGLGLRARSLAARQAAALEIEARTGRELGQDVKELEWFLRAAHLLPLHDVTRERAIVRERMKSIAARTPASGAGAALVDYAVGRGHLALREDAEAHERLARAARAGLDTPELHYALGLVQGRLYQKEIAEARRGGVQTWVERRTKEVELRYLQPALSSMERSRGVRLEAPSYLEGLMAFYRKDYEGALRLAQRARGEAPWLYEALQLEADVHLARGVERKDRGETEEALRELAEAGRLFDEASEIGRSDASLYEGSAEARIRKMEMAELTRIPLGDAYQVAMDRCAKAASARPDRSEPYTELAYAHQFAQHAAPPGDAQALLQRGLQAAERALAIGGGDFATYERLSGANQSIGLWQLEHGLDPYAALDAASAHAKRAIALDPAHPWGHAGLAVSHFYRGMAQIERGRDPSADFAVTVDACRHATESDQGYVIGYSNVLDVYVQTARWLVAHGEDPAPRTREAAETFAACVRQNPRYFECYENRGGIDAWYGAFDVLVGRDARPALAAAGENLEKAAEIGANVENRQRLAHLHLVRAEDLRQRGEDPGPALADARRMLADCFRLGPTDAVCTVLDAECDLFEADPGPPARPAPDLLERARARATLAIARNDHDADPYAVLAEAELRVAGVVRSRQAAEKHRDAGLAACTRGLTINPNHARLLLARGRLLLERSREAGDAERPVLARAAREALQQAFAINPLLKRRGGPSLADADRLAGGS